jgi:Tfp pilus assembly protein FimT
MIARRRREQGFTLIEIVVAMGIAILLLAVTAPLFTSTLKIQRGRAAVERVATDMRSAQSRAVSQGTPYALHSGNDVGRAGQYAVERSGSGSATDASFGLVDIWYNLSNDYTGVTFDSIKDSAAPAKTLKRVKFSPQGAVLSDDAVPASTLTFPIRVSVVTPQEGTKTITISRAGSIRMPQ